MLLLVEFGNPIFIAFSPGSYISVGICGSVVVFQRILHNDCKSGGKRIEPFTNGVALSDHQLSKFILGLMRLAPSELFNEATTTLLMPSVRSLGPLTMEQVQGAIPSPLPLGQSLLVVWPQLTGLIAATVICFAISYIMFMRREIRSR